MRHGYYLGRAALFGYCLGRATLQLAYHLGARLRFDFFGVLPDALALDLHRLCGGVEYRPISSLLARSWLPRSPSNPERPDAVSLGLG